MNEDTANAEARKAARGTADRGIDVRGVQRIDFKKGSTIVSNLRPAKASGSPSAAAARPKRQKSPVHVSGRARDSVNPTNQGDTGHEGKPTLAHQGLVAARDGAKQTHVPRRSAAKRDVELKRKAATHEANQRQTHDQALRNAIKMLLKESKGRRLLSFGDPSKPPSLIGPGGVFDHQYWEWTFVKRAPGSELHPWALNMKKGLKPSEAIAAIGEHPERWSLDCAAFVQVVQLLSLLETMKPEQFDSYMKKRMEDTQGLLILQPHYSTGVPLPFGYVSDKSGNGNLVRGATQVATRKTMKQLADDAPIGSQVVFENSKLPENNSYHFENTVKTGLDRYVGFPMGNKPYSENYLRRMLAESNPIDTVRISTIIVFDEMPR
jgi:Protein-glutamine gamma-glutamyltransferase